MKIKKYSFWTLALTAVLVSCNEKPETTSEEKNVAQVIIDSLENVYAPDGRVALFDFEAEKNADGFTIEGETNMPEAAEDLEKTLNQKGIKFTSNIETLPDAEGLEDQTMGVIKISVANLREEPRHASQLVTQATLGMPVKVYKKEGSWYYIQSPDGYLAWVDYGGIQNMTKEAFAAWKSKEKLIYLNPYGKSLKSAKNDAEVVSDLVAGDILEFTAENGNFYEISYPDGRTAFVPKSDAKPYKTWLADLEVDGESLISTGEKLMGLPYLWGGTSPKGVDCSGFTKTVYFLNGMVIPRDASQQVHTGVLVDSTRNFENLVAGDLLFFGRPATDSTKERVVHVGMWIGDQKFIHSMGDVHISTMDTTAEDFDEYNYNRYLRSKRILNEKDKGLQYLKEQDIFTE
ncbi:SH3 domain-containing protein [Zunongwangia mangrovi]|uniref:SH3 domain-containing protein n=1 Tax=Zunongwangia mangrovi TaxID=1334022 RepID=A0A1I1DNS3_9FLAO|nr:NlpC/P60 family protein [Zunongwangia mangrovi]SFB76066.1 SH3 domain-containing protein [Zunongwangia mangrovi]